MFSRESVIIKDGRKLSFDYVPPKLVGREKQMEMLSMVFRSVIDDGRSETAYITGSVGTGKTSTVKRFCMDMATYATKVNIPLDYIHINCRQSNTDALVMTQCIKHFDEKYPDKGYSAEVMMKDFRSHVMKSKKRMIIVLDEVNSLIRAGNDDLIYQLSRMGEDLYGQMISVSLILISQEYVLDRIDVASLSTFKRANTIRFDKYTSNQLKDIVRARVDEAMIPGTITDDAIDAITDMSADVGDARIAIDILDKAARLAEMRPNAVVTREDVAAVSDMVSSVVNITRLETLGKNELFTLLSFARATRKKPYVSLQDAEKTYAIVCEEYDVPARKHTQFFTYTDSLVKDGLLVCRDAEGGGKAKEYCIQDIPPRQMCKKLEELIEKVVR